MLSSLTFGRFITIRPRALGLESLEYDISPLKAGREDRYSGVSRVVRDPDGTCAGEVVEV